MKYEHSINDALEYTFTQAISQTLSMHKTKLQIHGTH